MEKVKPITIGIIALLLVLLSFNFVPQKNPKEPKSSPQVVREPLQAESGFHRESNATIAQNNAELIQKNIDFLKENLEALKADFLTESLKEDSATNSTPQTALDMTESQQETPIKQAIQCQRAKPQLAIIIDDIGTFAQYQALTKIKYKITPSLFPKSKTNPQTPKIARVAPFFMVHLPLEALNFYQAEHEWLFVGDSQAKIEQRIQTIKQDFPTLTYLNNHTGSKFTQNLDSMRLLLEILAKYKISFLDSKTAPNTKTKAFYTTHFQEKLNPCQGDFLERDVFLDNELNIPKITQNLIQAVKIAKTKGYAIAIGHPHNEILLGNKNAKDYRAKNGVELADINEIIAP